MAFDCPADLLEPGSFDEAMSGCQVVFHVASPHRNFAADPKDIDVFYGASQILMSIILVLVMQRQFLRGLTTGAFKA